MRRKNHIYLTNDLFFRLFFLIASLIAVLALIFANTHLFFRWGSILIWIIILAVILLFELFIFIKWVLDPVKEIEKTINSITTEDVGYLLNYSSNDSNRLEYKIIKPISDYLKKLFDAKSTTDIIRKQTEFIALQSQINPHFLYNTLESIRGQAIVDGATEIAEMIEALSNFFRYSISIKGDLVTLEDELKNVDNYCKIQSFRFAHKFDFCLECYANDELLECFLPKLTIQPIIENAINHGLKNVTENGKIILRVEFTERVLIINIVDNGIGMDKESLSALNDRLRNGLNNNLFGDGKGYGGMALSNVNQRIKLLFGEEFGVTVSSIQNFGTDVEVLIPLVREKTMKEV